MRLFNTLSLEINAQCNRKCKFCPVAYNTRPDERMAIGLVNKAAAELAHLNYKGRIELYIYNEPLKDKTYLRQVTKLLRKHVPKCTLMIATNGDYIRDYTDIMEMYEWGMNQVLINCYSPGLYERRQVWFSGLPAEVRRHKSVYDQGFKGKCIQMLDKSSPQKFGTGIFSLTNRAGNIDQFLPVVEEPLQKMCVRPFRLLNINWLGQALVCCQDYHADVPIGNLQDNTLVELWNHPVLNTYRKHLSEKDRTLPLCNQCDCHSGAYPGNVDKSFGKPASRHEIANIHATNVRRRNRASKV